MLGSANSNFQSDHPVLNSRYLLYEAAQAFYYGLPAGPALASVITTPADVAGFGHRLGRVKIGYDAGTYMYLHFCLDSYVDIS